MHSIIFLGTGPGVPAPGRGSSSSLLELASAKILVDAGEPCSLHLRDRGIEISDLDAVLITHGHSDHTAGLFMLLQSAWLESRQRPLPIYLPQELIEPLKAWLNAVYLPEKLLGFPLLLHPWTLGKSAEAAPGVEVEVFATTHLDGLRQMIEPEATQRFKTFGLMIHGNGHRVVYSSDLGAPQDLECALSSRCDVLVCELAHFLPSALFSFLQGREIDTLVLNHLSPKLAGQEKELAAQVRRELPHVGRVFIPHDGESLEF